MRKNAQSMIEIAIVLAAMAAGILMMMVYVKSSFSGKVKQSADSLGEGFDPRNGVSKAQSVQYGESAYTVSYVNGSQAGFNDWRKDKVFPTSVQTSGSGADGMQSVSTSQSTVSYDGVN